MMSLPPRANPDLSGQDAAERVLLEAWYSGRMPHAWLLGGRRGVGKATLAFRFARFVLAQSPDAPALGHESLAVARDHPVFRRVASGGHGDLRVLERQPMKPPRERRLSAEIVVEQVRDIEPFFRLTAAEQGWRIAIIDGAEEMNAHAANALLKILEEPPARALLLLVSHAPGRLLPTIRSRCRYLPLPPLAPETVAGLIARYRPGTSKADGALLVGLADGSIGRALELLDTGGADAYRAVSAVLAGLPTIDVAAAHAVADRLARAGVERDEDGATDDSAGFRLAVEMLGAWVGRAARAAVGAATPDWSPGEREAMTRAIAASGGGRRLEPWLAVWDKLARCVGRTEGLNLDRRQALLDALLSIEEAARR